MRVPSIFVRVAILAVLALGWWWLSSEHPGWMTAAADWVRTRPWLADPPLAAVSAILLATYLALLLWSRFNPRRRRGVDSALAESMTLILVIVLLVLGALLAVGWFFHVGAIVKIVAAVTILPTIQLVLSLIVTGIGVALKRWAMRERWLGAADLTSRLAGSTHVIERVSADQPPRRWRELRYYAPDGRMVGYAEEDGRVRAYPAIVTWRVEGDLLETVTSLEPGKTRRYRLALGPDAQISYHHVEPGSPLDGLVFRTIEIRRGEPSVTGDDASGRAISTANVI
jgi:hypothetical protein